ncbi:1-deoxy-D-xylulose-5-phosphate synthase [Desulfatirhabdium butyrativorans]|uniref:1-deoxy-D-xylulose-5-phosphate synthase n=1 Tax=Desulfatirhabdium butyrativorans TaxID=340467 RepID=UPI00041112AF|nr:1-deoxy-D-xylulose-5-phosphate synthase [Desulfatirhabdium butyrativorans]
MGLLETIQSPKDLKQLPRKQLPGLAAEIRSRIIDVVSKTGGHLASSLGAVELAIALHYVFDVPRDKIVWDVGHQSYAHKLLTGRQRRFDTLRQYKGLSGFTRMSESPCDAFTTGHSSTSISSALGMACFRRIAKRDGDVIAVIGDGSLTAGLAYEGLNQAGDIHKNLIVILNDNDMSIDHNVGALSSFLSRKFSAKMLQDLRREFGEFLKSLPGIGDDIYQFAKRTEESFKSFVTPGMLFEAFNFEYFGPINGHHIGHLIDILENIQHMSEPVLLHVTTVKGKGYPPAERNPIFFHGVGCFDAASGECYPASSTVPSYTEVFGETLVELAKTHPKIVAVTAAMPEGTGLTHFAELFPDRFFDVGIAEQHGVTFAAGMATEGAKPVVAIYSTFLQRAYDQIVHDVCIEALPVVFALDRGGIVGEDGPTHHGLFDLSYLRVIPNMVVMAPSNENELARMLCTAIHHDGPSALRYPRGKGVGVAIERPLSPIPVGKAELLSEGSDVLLIGIGRPVNECLAAVQELQKEGVSVALIDARFVKPLDAELICEWTRRTPWIVTVEENALQGGFGSAILELLCDRQIPFRRVIRLGIEDHFVEHGPQPILREQEGIDSKAIEHAVRTLLQNRKSE